MSQSKDKTKTVRKAMNITDYADYIGRSRPHVYYLIEQGQVESKINAKGRTMVIVDVPIAEISQDEVGTIVGTEDGLSIKQRNELHESLRYDDPDVYIKLLNRAEWYAYKGGWSSYSADLGAIESINVPTVAGMAIAMGVPRHILRGWVAARDTTKMEIIMACEYVLAKQEVMLINGGLSNTFNTAISRLMLISSHGYDTETDTDILSRGIRVKNEFTAPVLPVVPAVPAVLPSVPATITDSKVINVNIDG